MFSLAALVLAGCPRGQSPLPADEVKPASLAPRASVALRVLVVNDEALAEGINRLRGEWAERSGGTLAAESKPWAEISKKENVNADLLIFPARYLGELVAANRIRPMRESALHSEVYDADDILPLARQKLGTFGRRAMALPLSVEMPLFGVERESESGRRQGESPAAIASFVWPTRNSIEHWPAVVLLARAAGYASHPRQEAVLFDPQTMAARIAEPPFVRALEEWRRAEQSGTQAVTEQVREPIVGLGIPAAAEAYNRSTDEWEPVAGGKNQVPMLAGGTLLAVTTSSRNAASAFELAAWLASPEIVSQLGPIGDGSLPVRRSVLRRGARAIDVPAGQLDAAQNAKVVEAALNRDDALFVPRVPGADKYLAALSQAVDKALRGEVDTAAALDEAASNWNEITERLGRDAQRRAYLADLGIDQP